MYWKTHPKYTNYLISNTGLIKSKERYIVYPDGHKQIHHEHIMNPHKSKWGYSMIKIAYKGKKITKQVNDLVAETFIPNPQNLPETHHIDYNKQNNNVENLKWVSHEFNMKDKSKHYHELLLKQNPSRTESKDGKILYKCPFCNAPMNYKAALCTNCRKKYRKTHINGYYITPEHLIAILNFYNGNFTKTGKLFDVTGNAIVNYLKRHSLPYHSKNYQ